jgi:hypothetical protein
MAYAYAVTGRVPGNGAVPTPEQLDEHGIGEPDKIAAELSFPNELDPGLRYVEGARKQVWVNAFERDSRARQACVVHYGYDCAVCGVNFADRYGSIGQEFIHVHHLKPMALTDLKRSKIVNPGKQKCQSAGIRAHI